jgi:hypothetical protein
VAEEEEVDLVVDLQPPQDHSIHLHQKLGMENLRLPQLTTNIRTQVQRVLTLLIILTGIQQQERLTLPFINTIYRQIMLAEEGITQRHIC